MTSRVTGGYIPLSLFPIPELTAQEYYERGNTLLRQENIDFEAVIREFKQGINAGPDRQTDFFLHHKLGLLLCDLNRYQESESYLEKAILLATPDEYTNMQVLLAFALAKQHHLAASKAILSKVVFDGPINHYFLTNLGITFMEQHQLEDAEKLLKQALVANNWCPAYRPQQHYFLAKCYGKQKKIPEALKEIDIGLAIAPEQKNLLDLKKQIENPESCIIL